MVYVPAGEFPYGPGSIGDPPKQSIYLDASFISIVPHNKRTLAFA